MTWKTYDLDRYAQRLVMQAHPDALNQSYKMRMAVAYGLERFWGEHLRLQGKEQNKADYWKSTWDALVKILSSTGIQLPNDPADTPEAIETMAKKLWGEIPVSGNTSLTTEDQRLALAVLTQLCDCIVWWTQRLKGVA